MWDTKNRAEKVFNGYYDNIMGDVVAGYLVSEYFKIHILLK